MLKKSVTCTAPVNIAVIKYWGKSDEQLILPLNDSVSLTLCQDQLCARTSVSLVESAAAAEDEFWLNGERQTLSTPRFQNCIAELRRRAGVAGDGGGRLRIVSQNNFPTAAGLASSAAGFACLTAAMARLYGVQGDVSDVARRGSGSACRSMLGGFVRWKRGQKSDGSDSVAVQVAPADHWPEMRCLILVVNDERKKTPSSVGMARTAQTSQLMRRRIEQCVPERVERLCAAVLARDFATFGELTMRDSNEMHAVCQDTYPPVRYMTDVSHAIVDLVHRYNERQGRVAACYTFDAGPNACIYLLQEQVAGFLATVKAAFPPKEEKGWLKGLDVQPVHEDDAPLQVEPVVPAGIRYVIYTCVGDGPRIIDEAS